VVAGAVIVDTIGVVRAACGNSDNECIAWVCMLGIMGIVGGAGGIMGNGGIDAMVGGIVAIVGPCIADIIGMEGAEVCIIGIAWGGIPEIMGIAPAVVWNDG
jgi:hypothetical protein